MTKITKSQKRDLFLALTYYRSRAYNQTSSENETSLKYLELARKFAPECKRISLTRSDKHAIFDALSSQMSAQVKHNARSIRSNQFDLRHHQALLEIALSF